ncbi:hypothetical protein [Faecalibacillus faecis]|uniref:hypothetical protein n=1 Tax=Faecalibacillus faecis TaxID=1982628 RepID=UPI003868B834
MSHYSVAVIIKKEQMKDNTLENVVEKALAPFDENREVPLYTVHTKQDLIAKERLEYLLAIREREILKSGNTEFSFRFKKEFLETLDEKKVDIDSDEELYQEAIKRYDPDMIDEYGNVTSTYNPNSKWDWYEIVGGRWNNLLNLKDGSKGYLAEIKDVSFEPDKEEYNRALRFWKLYVDKREEELTEEEKNEIGFVFYSRKYFKDKYGSKEEYAKAMSSFSTYAILDSNGTWHEPGPMGWFGMSYASVKEEKKFIDKYMDIINKENPDNLIVIVDCHI